MAKLINYTLEEKVFFIELSVSDIQFQRNTSLTVTFILYPPMVKNKQCMIYRENALLLHKMMCHVDLYYYSYSMVMDGNMLQKSCYKIILCRYCIK